MSRHRKADRTARQLCCGMTDDELITIDHRLRKEIPTAQALHAAVRRERKRRRSAKQVQR